MTQKEFADFAAQNNISERYYSLDGNYKNDDVVYLVKKFDQWEVYYFERGLKFDSKVYASESEAIDDVYNRFKSAIDRGYKFN